MPELPEVELVCRALAQTCLGRRIVAARLLRPRLAPETTPAVFARRLHGGRIEKVSRRGKHILIELDKPFVLITHLRMTGRFLLLPPAWPLPAYTHALFKLDNNQRLAFTDHRHFGMMKVVRAAELYQTRELSSLAPEPFSKDFSEQYLVETLANTKRPLKEVLLDQTKVTGLGNIYAAEALFLAGINPRARASSLSRGRIIKLRQAILAVLGESIQHGSTLNVDPQNLEGSYYGGGYKNRWYVYDREGEPCSRCASVIKRTVHAGRSTYYCRRCQR